jgi:imidazolonepropionase-like amidohydrolase
MSDAGSIAGGVVLIDNGKISRVGDSASVPIPADYERISVRVAAPGLIDAHSVLGLAGMYNVPADQDSDERTDPNQAHLRAIDGFNPREPLLDYVLRFGVTVVQSGPGRANVIGGQAGIFKTRAATVEAATLRFPSAVIFTLGEAPKAAYGAGGKEPATRMATAALIRRALVEARDYARKMTDPDESKRPARNLKLESLARVVSGELPAVMTVHREDDILTAIRLAKEFELKLILDAATEGYLAVDAIRASGAPVFVHPPMQRIDAPETMNASLENAAILARAGIPIAIQSGFEDYVPKARIVLFEAGVAAANGLGFEPALRAITIDAARLLAIDDRVGSIEEGKDADLALFDGDPFEYASHVEAVIINGEVAHRRAR